MDPHQRKHDLVEQSCIEHHNVTERPNLKKKRILSLRRPKTSSSLSLSQSRAQGSDTGADTDPETISANTSGISELSCGPQHSPSAECDSTHESTTIKEPASLLLIPSGATQEECYIQKDSSAEAKEGAENPYQADGVDSRHDTCSSALKEKSMDDATLAIAHSSHIPNTNIPSNPGNDAMVDPDCCEDIDEIQGWDMDEFKEDCTNGGEMNPVPENACPVCGLDLLKLDTMTPDAHVNRCLDGSGTDNTSTEYSPDQASTRNPFASLISTIQSAIHNTVPSRKGDIKDVVKSNKQASAAKRKDWKPKQKVSRPCPFYKRMPDTSFTVDAFCYGSVDGCDAYFLSHFHSDHYGGLTSTWDHGLIYCSSITANLVISRLRVDEKYIRRLPMYEPTVVNGVTVRLMDANHCPGSVLFVFDLQNPKRRYLHTGDFRASPDMSINPILQQPKNAPIDILYLDTTYINPRYTFPPQDIVIRETANLVCREIGLQTAPVSEVKIVKKANIMERWLKQKSGNDEKLHTMSIKSSQTITMKQKWQEPGEKSRIVICVGTYLIGKERVFKAIAKAIKSKVYVQPSKQQILECLDDAELMNMLTPNRLEAQVHLLHMGSGMSPEALQDYLDSLGPTFTRLIAIRPTGWTFTGSKKFTPADNGSTDWTHSTPNPTTLDLRPTFTSSTVKIYPVPYSEHSSFNELAGFVRSLNIHRVIPTVGVGSEKGRHAMNEWFRLWEEERKQGIGWV